MNTHITTYEDIAEMIKAVPKERLNEVSNFIGYILYSCNVENIKVENLKKAIVEGKNSNVVKDFNAQDFLLQLKSERKNGSI